MKVNNPILPGFYPDPTLLAVGKDYYIVNSTFAYFPGLPVFHSRDLCHWEQIGNVMDRKSQLPLADTELSQGLFAPTMRYHDGKYYVICTNISKGGNYIVTADKPEGPWSEPHYLGWDVAPGIDPSLFFDDDGTCYYIGTRDNPNGGKYFGDNYIWIQKLNLETMKMEGEPYFVWNGAMRDIPWPEGPHLYKKDGYYYIVYAEGGTGPHHSVCVIRSKEIGGPYENNFCNPIISHRYMGKKYPVQYVGHADLIQAADDEWYMVMLAVRPKEGYTNIGRETFLAKVVWEDGWPVVNPGSGILGDTVEVTLPEWDPQTAPDSYTVKNGWYYTNPSMDKNYDFESMAAAGTPLGFEFLRLREPLDDMYELNSSSKALRIYPNQDKLTVCGNAAYIGIRQSHHNCLATTTFDATNLKAGDKAGIALMQNHRYMVKVEFCDGMASVIKVSGGNEEVINSVKCELPSEAVKLWIQTKEEKADFGYGDMALALDVDIHELSTEVAGGFVGCTIGMYAETDREYMHDSYVDFKNFTYAKKA